MTKKRIHLIYSIVLSVMLVVAGICLITACVGIYLSGDQPFSREAVAAAFSGIAIPVYLCLALVIGGFILDGFFPTEKKKLPVEKQYSVILARLHSKLALDRCDEPLRSQILAQQKKRKLHQRISLALLITGSVIFLCYGLRSSNFHQSEINSSMIRAMWVFLPCLAVPFAWAVFSAHFSRASIKKEIELVKQAIATGCQNDALKCSAPTKNTGKPLLILRCGLLIAGIGILVYGFFSGGTSDVLTKAINICTECVGLG